MKSIKQICEKKARPVRVLQFGEGNFLRAFADYMIARATDAGVYDGSVAVVQPINAPLLGAFAEQASLYTVLLRGKENGKTVNEPYTVTCVDRVISSYADYDDFMSLAHIDTLECVISNTTEAGIVLDESDRFELTPPQSYPGKLTKFLYERYTAFDGDTSRGLVIFPVELIENNGGKLRECVLSLCKLWSLEDAFAEWVDSSCMFCSTLVDRIVTGYPRGDGDAARICEELGYSDGLLDICEPFALWVIEAENIERARAVLPLDRAGLPVIFTHDQRPYRERKVRILNGAHTSFVPAAFLSGESIVRDCMANKTVRAFIDRCIYGEIMPTLTLPREELEQFAASVCERFENPFIDHELISICLNSVSKWKARVLPSLVDSLEANGKLPPCLTLSFAALCEFYSRGRRSGDGFFGTRTVDGCESKYKISDDRAVIDFFAENAQREDIVRLFAEREDFWGRSLAELELFVEKAEEMLALIRREGALAAMERAVAESENK